MSDPAAAAPDDDIIGKAYDARLMRRLLGYLRPHWRSVLLGLVVIVATALLQLVQPWLTKVAIDEHIVRGDLAGVGRVAATASRKCWLSCTGLPFHSSTRSPSLKPALSAGPLGTTSPTSAPAW